MMNNVLLIFGGEMAEQSSADRGATPMTKRRPAEDALRPSTWVLQYEE